MKVKTLRELCVKYEVSQASIHRLTGIPYGLIGLWYNLHRPTPGYIITMVEKMLRLKQAAENEDIQAIRKLFYIE